MNPEDLTIETYPYPTKGGQHVNDARCGVKITHIPSGLVAISEAGRAQFINRDVALAMIEAGLNKMEYKTDIPPKP
jgi:protein subunit release factor A